MVALVPNLPPTLIRVCLPAWRCALALAVVGATLAGCGGGATTPDADFAGTVNLDNGREICMECRGSGMPTVVPVSGLGERADNWMTLPDPATVDRAVFRAVAGFSRVYAHDRLGTATATATGVASSLSMQVPHLATVQVSATDLDLTADGLGRGGALRPRRSLAGRPHHPSLCRRAVGDRFDPRGRRPGAPGGGRASCRPRRLWHLIVGGRHGDRPLLLVHVSGMPSKIGDER